MDRPIQYTQEQLRSFDLLNFYKDVLKGLCRHAGDIFFGGATVNTATLLSGFVATASSPINLTVNLTEGEIYEFNDIDATAYGTLTADTNEILQQGYQAAQTITISTSGLLSGQSQWVLVECQFQQTDAVRTGDPTGGVLPYYNINQPGTPLSGPGGTGAVQKTVRQGVAFIKVVYGAPATTGSEVPPGVDAGYVPLYLIDINFGQTTISQNQILTAGPSAYTGYTQAPFISGLLNSHHNGVIGQAPKIILTGAKEIQGVIPIANTPATSTNSTGLLATIYSGSGAPSATTLQTGNYAVKDLYIDTTNNILYVCTTAGTQATSVWTRAIPTQSIAQPPFSNSQLSGPLLDAVTAGTGIAVTAPPASGVGSQQVACSNVPNIVLQGPLLSGLVAGTNISITNVSGSGTFTPTISANIDQHAENLPHSFTANNGYNTFAGGFIIQWTTSGKINLPYNSGFNISLSFPISFPNSCLFITPQLINVDAPNEGNIQITGSTFNQNGVTVTVYVVAPISISASATLIVSAFGY